MERMVLGFYWSEGKVVLIRKARPAWQAGRLNGVGGHVEPTDESPQHAMAREMREEAGIETGHYEWRLFATMRCEEEEWEVLCYHAVGGQLPRVMNTDEPAGLYSRDISRRFAVVENLDWLLHLSLDCNPRLQPVVINYIPVAVIATKEAPDASQ